MNLDVRDLAFSYHNSGEILHKVSFAAHDGDLIAVLGPNGVGKSTLFRCILGFLPKYKGTISVDGREARSLSRREFARCIAYVPQSSAPVFDYTVKELVLMGLTNHIGMMSSPKKEHEERALEALEQLGIADIAERGCGQVSGGQRQLALLARALVQDARILVMDEPTANLDYGNQYRVIERISHLGEQGYIVIMSTHDPNQALVHCNRALVMKGGFLIADGAPEEILTEELLSRLYGIRVGRTDGVGTQDEHTFCFPVGYLS